MSAVRDESYEGPSLVHTACGGNRSVGLDASCDGNDSASLSTACERDDPSNIGTGAMEYGRPQKVSGVRRQLARRRRDDIRGGRGLVWDEAGHVRDRSFRAELAVGRREVIEALTIGRGRSELLSDLRGHSLRVYSRARCAPGDSQSPFALRWHPGPCFINSPSFLDVLLR